MNGTDVVSIMRKSTKCGKGLQLSISAKWLSDMGFALNSLVQVLPEPGGLSFTLHDETFTKYSELLSITTEMGGTLMKVSLHYRPRLGLSGVYLRRAGLRVGDNLLVLYKHGFIRARKIQSGAVRVVKSHLVGRWLEDLGFECGTDLIISSEPGAIICKLCDDVVLQSSVKLLAKTRLENRVPCITIHSSLYEHAGFEQDDELLASYEYGLIRLWKPDFVSLGF